MCTHSARSAASRSTITGGEVSRRRRCPQLDVGPPVASRGRGRPCRRGDGLPGLSWTRPTTYGRGVPARPAQGSSTPRCGRAPTCIAAPLAVREVLFSVLAGLGGGGWRGVCVLAEGGAGSARVRAGWVHSPARSGSHSDGRLNEKRRAAARVCGVDYIPAKGGAVARGQERRWRWYQAGERSRGGGDSSLCAAGASRGRGMRLGDGIVVLF